MILLMVSVREHSLLDALLHTYLSSEVTQFLSICETHIHKITSGAVLASLFRDLVYLCDGLSIIHCNFYCLLQTLMTDTVAKLMDSYISFHLWTDVFFIDTGNWSRRNSLHKSPLPCFG